MTYSATPPAGGESVEKVEIPPGPTAEQTRQTEERLERYRTQTKEWEKEREARRPAKRSSAGQTVDEAGGRFRKPPLDPALDAEGRDPESFTQPGGFAPAAAEAQPRCRRRTRRGWRSAPLIRRSV